MILKLSKNVLVLPTRYRLNVRNRKRHFASNTEQTLRPWSIQVLTGFCSIYQVRHGTLGKAGPPDLEAGKIPAASGGDTEDESQETPRSVNRADMFRSNSRLAQKHDRQALKADFIQDIQRAKPFFFFCRSQKTGVQGQQFSRRCCLLQRRIKLKRSH